VFDILVKWVDCRDWRKALFDVMPQRKFTSVGKSTRRAKGKSGSASEPVAVTGEEPEMKEDEAGEEDDRVYDDVDVEMQET
jgi:tRNA (guanine9-N1)-methyltransferase